MFYCVYIGNSTVSNNARDVHWGVKQASHVQNKFLVSKETVVLRRWERSKQKFGFIKRVDKG